MFAVARAGRMATGRSVPLLRMPVQQWAPRPMLRTQLRQAANIVDTSASAVGYPMALRYFHWGMAGGTIVCFGLVQAAMQTKGKTRGQLMFWHKSVGAALLIATVGRVGVRARAMLSKSIPPHLPNPLPLKLAASAAHAGLYFFMIMMPLSGVAMGYYGGRGIPFFFTTIPGAETPNKEIAKNTYNFHKNAGQAYEYLVPLHAGGSLLHVIRGHKVFERLSIFNKASKVV